MKKILLSAVAMAMTMAATAQIVQYEKVTTAPTDWSGEYLIVREVTADSTLVFDGRIEDDLDAKNNCFLVMRAGETIAFTAQLDSATFTIANQGDTAWSCCSKSGLYFGYNSYSYESDNVTVKNTLKSGADNKYPLYISMENGKLKILAKCGYELRYNDDPTHNRFRFHAEGKKKSICLYKRVETTTSAVENTEVKNHKVINGALYGLPEGFFIENGQVVRRLK